MKKILALLLAMIMICTLAACGNNTADDTDGGKTANTESSTTGTEGATESTSATDGTEESTSATEGTQAPTEDTKPTEKPTEQTKPTEKPTEQTKPTEPSNPTEPSHKHGYDGKVTTPATCTEKGTKTFTCSCGSYYTESILETGHSFGEWETTKEPTAEAEGNSQRTCSSCGATENKSIAKLPAAQSYYVGLELVSIEHKTTEYDIDGMNFFDKIYGKNSGGQLGDVVTYKINTSDGKPVDIRIDEAQNCSYIIDGNTLKMTFTDARVWENWAYLSFYAKDENGTEKKFSTKTFTVVTDGQEITTTGLVSDAIKHYASRLGLRFVTGQAARDEGLNSTNYDDYDNVKIPNNPNWLREVIKVVERYKTEGCTIYNFQLVWQDGWQGIAK